MKRLITFIFVLVFLCITIPTFASGGHGYRHGYEHGQEYGYHGREVPEQHYRWYRHPPEWIEPGDYDERHIWRNREWWWTHRRHEVFRRHPEWICVDRLCVEFD